MNIPIVTKYMRVTLRAGTFLALAALPHTVNADSYMSPDQILKFETSQSVAQVIGAKKLNGIKVPVSSADQASYESACQKGPRPFYAKLMPTIPMPAEFKSWKDVTMSDPLTYCRALVAEYKTAIKDPVAYQRAHPAFQVPS